MRVAVLGCGSMGTILGAFLTKGGIDVELIDINKSHIDAMNLNGAQIIGTKNFNVKVKAITPDQMKGTYDIVFLFTKQTANKQVLTNLVNYIDKNSIVCTLQNGVPEPYVASFVGEDRTIGGTVLWSATYEKPGVSNLTQNLDNLDYYFDIGEIDGKQTNRIREVAEILNLMGPTKIVENLMPTRWAKLINNACMSGMSAATNLTFGGVLENETARACLSYLGREVKKCCEAEGYIMPTLVLGYSPVSLDIKDQKQYDENQKMFIDMYQMALPAKASMLQDLEKGNKTEVSMINGYVCEVGRKYGIPTPFNDKVVEIVTKIEDKILPLSEENINLFDKSLFEYEKYEGK